ncbi:hypothetical protein PRVXT_000479 [Proteinivorax tanatarense]|uniref:Uncharacterized protein n=1 Tax=Proteinivorax tanatarense TaxID=1260629 RepID=A0AAU7VMS6_9FIRM
MKSTPILGVISIAFIFILLATSLGNSDVAEPELQSMRVESSLDRYGSEEVIHVNIKNISDNKILFGDNFMGLKMFERLSAERWERYYPDVDIKNTITSLEPKEEVDLEIRCVGIEPGEYKLVFEGWEKGNHNSIISQDVDVIITPYPKIKVESEKTDYRPRDTIELTVINDRLQDITFPDSTLGMELYIQDGDEWVLIPSPMYKDYIELVLSPGQMYELSIPPLRGTGRYKFMFYGVDSEDRVITAEKEISIKRR